MSGHVYDPILVAEYYNVQVNLWRYFFSIYLTVWTAS